MSCQESQHALDCRHALEPYFSAEFIQSSQHSKDKEEEKWFNVPSTQTNPEDNIQDRQS